MTQAAPRIGLNREEAAASVGVSPNVFDRMVTAGELPKPHRSKVSKRLIWHISELSAAIRDMDTGDLETVSPYEDVQV